MLDVSYFDKFNANGGIPFMEGREKGNLSDMLNYPLHIADFAFLSDEDNREYAVMVFQEDSERFYFGNSIVTEMLRTVEQDGAKPIISQRAIKFDTRKSKQRGRTYTTFQFV